MERGRYPTQTRSNFATARAPSEMLSVGTPFETGVARTLLWYFWGDGLKRRPPMLARSVCPSRAYDRCPTFH